MKEGRREREKKRTRSNRPESVEVIGEFFGSDAAVGDSIEPRVSKKVAGHPNSQSGAP
jgi:hypothetical protein